MSFEKMLVQSTKKRAEELEKKRGSGDVFEPSPLSEREEKEYIKKRNRLKIKENNRKLKRKK